MLPRCLFVTFAILSLGRAQASTAQEWPEFRGPGGQGHSSERGLPVEWSESKNVVWKTLVPGLGWSSPVVARGRVWVTAAVDSRDINPKNSFASATPVVEEDRVDVHFGADGTAALTTAGEVVWRTKLPYESQHGAGGSPIVYGDLLIVSCDGHDAAHVVALDKRTGKVQWKTNRRRPVDQAYSTPLIIRVGGRDQIVSVGAFRAAAYDPTTGREIWRVSYTDGFSNVPRPVYGHGLVYIATGFQQPALIAVRPDGAGDVTRTHIAWTLRRAAPLTPSPLLVGDELYVVTGGGIATCLDARTGAVHWQMRLGGTYSASAVFADGRIYFLGEQGAAIAIAPGKAFRRVGASTLDGAMLASMAVAHGSLFIRTNSHLYRIAAPRTSAGQPH
jgi:outer membrane protein assembly factor BamB